MDFEIQTDYHIQSIITILVILKEQHYFLQELPPNLNQELQKTNFDKYWQMFASEDTKSVYKYNFVAIHIYKMSFKQ